MKLLLVLVLIATIIIAGCTQNTPIPSSVLLTKAEVESAGFSVLNESTYNISTLESITKVAKGDQAIVKATEATIGYKLPISGSEKRFEIQNGQDKSNGLVEELSIFDTEANAKLYFSHTKEGWNNEYWESGLSGYDFGDESYLTFNQDSSSITYASVVRKGNSVVVINIFSKVSAQDGFVKITSTAANKIK
jgi:hypothetical protein